MGRFTIVDKLDNISGVESHSRFSGRVILYVSSRPFKGWQGSNALSSCESKNIT